MDSKLPNSSPRRLQIVNTKVCSLCQAAHSVPFRTQADLDSPDTQRQSVICELLFPTTILAVRMNRKRLIVVLELEIYIYDISTMKLLHTLETGPNPDGELACARYDERTA